MKIQSIFFKMILLATVTITFSIHGMKKQKSSPSYKDILTGTTTVCQYQNQKLAAKIKVHENNIKTIKGDSQRTELERLSAISTEYQKLIDLTPDDFTKKFYEDEIQKTTCKKNELAAELEINRTKQAAIDYQISLMESELKKSKQREEEEKKEKEKTELYNSQINAMTVSIQETATKEYSSPAEKNAILANMIYGRASLYAQDHSKFENEYTNDIRRARLLAFQAMGVDKKVASNILLPDILK